MCVIYFMISRRYSSVYISDYYLCIRVKLQYTSYVAKFQQEYNIEQVLNTVQ